ncbi:MAG TPA: MYXO-CTERM sorting domain-containing protein [Nannocystaceae bacterium]|nr:MYXO-CTERM sorting domain-containing protein [Nannocystaceae bacterium]
MRTASFLLALAFAPALAPLVARAGEPAVVQNPYATEAKGPVVIDVAAGTVNGTRKLVVGEPTSRVRFEDLDEHVGSAISEGRVAAELPAGLVQIDDMIVPDGVQDGAMMVGDADLVGQPHAQQIPADSCTYPDEVPPGIYEGDKRRGGEFPRRGTIYLNFTGGVLNTGAENSAENLSQIALSGHEYPAFTGGEAKAIAVAQAVQTDFAAWAIRVVYDPRPRKLLPYTMAMVGGHYSDTSAGPSSGVAPIDCEDFGQRNVCYSFTNGEPATSQANVVSQEVAHTYGLEHTYGADRIMSYEGGGDKIFGSNCQETFALPNQGNGCQGVNKCHCGVGDYQDDTLTIGMIYAPAGPDETAPTIELTEPADGSVFHVGDPIIVGLDPWDDYGGYGWKLVIEDEQGEVLVDEVDYDRALELKVVGLPAGTYTFTGEVEDQADHVATHSITVIVEGELADTGADDDAGSDGDADGSGDGTDSDDDADDDAGSDTAGDDSGDGDGDGTVGESSTAEGCSCTTDRTPPTAWLAFLAIAGLRRRRT